MSKAQQKPRTNSVAWIKDIVEQLNKHITDCIQIDGLEIKMEIESSIIETPTDVIVIPAVKLKISQPL